MVPLELFELDEELLEEWEELEELLAVEPEKLDDFSVLDEADDRFELDEEVETSDEPLDVGDELENTDERLEVPVEIGEPELWLNAELAADPG